MNSYVPPGSSKTVQLTERSARVSVPSSEVIGMSETEYGASWLPANSDDTEEDAEPAADPEPDETPGRYTPDYLAEYTASMTPRGTISLNLFNPALAPLYAVPGDTIRVHDHLDSILLTHAAHERGADDE